VRRSSYRTFITFLTCAVAVGGALWAQTGREVEPSVAYAHVNGDGTLDIAHSKNVLAMGGGDGLYCFKLAFVPKSATATIANDPTAPNQGLGFISAAVPPTPTFTCATVPKPDAVVETSNETSVGSGESAGGYAFYAYWTR
jgi:hypothetical protein